VTLLLTLPVTLLVINKYRLPLSRLRDSCHYLMIKETTAGKT
jgi:hypothetical protein